ncbi:DUF4145 domain-containing protein, partial [Cetobacterium sp.]|uniref:DUF4145 domain-containing protein n=1 Tax=Cetobacterium sp. TaxID=2071632 RepID=UPI0025C69BFF
MFIESKYKKDVFTCLYCNGNNQHIWDVKDIYEDRILSYVSNEDNNKIAICYCVICNEISFWYNEKLIYPLRSNLPKANEDMPIKIKELYNEAKDVYSISKKSSAALLRLALQYLCIELGENGKNINEDIGRLVSRGLSVEVQQVLDILRVTGNNAVHPGQLNLDEDSELVIVMFEYLNIIVEKFYTEPKRIRESYEKLPKGIKKAIEERKELN